MGDQNYKLFVELLLKDRLSGGLSKSEVRLRLFGRESKQALQAYKQLRAELGKAMPHLNMPRITTPGTAGRSGVSNVRQEIQFLRQQTKLRQEQARLSGVESRNKAQATQAGLRGLQQESRLRKEVNSEIQRGARDEIRLQREQLNLRQAKTRAIQSGELHDLKYQREQIRLQRQLAGSRREAQTSRRERIDRYAQIGQTGIQVARGTFDALTGFTDPALDMMRSRQRFRLMGFPQDETTRGLSAVEDVTRQTRGVRRVDVQETLTSLVNSLGSVDEAIKFLPTSAKYLANMQALHGDEYGPSEVTRQIKSTFKALETLGVNRPTGPKDQQGHAIFTDEDHKRVEKYFDIMAQASAATGGDINPNELRAFTRYSRMAGQGLTPEGMRNILPMIQELGGAQTGSALMALYTNMVGGTIPSHKLREWQSMGLLDMSKVEFSKKTDQIKRLRPGAIPIAEGLGQNPMAVADRLTDAFRKKGIDVSDTEAVNKQIISMFGNIRGAGAMAVMINQRALIGKEARNYERASGIGQTYSEVFGGPNPLGQIADRQTAWTNLQATSAEGLAIVGGAISEKIANQMKALDAVAKDHPTYAAAALGVLSLGKASVDAAGGVSLLGGKAFGVVNGSGGGGGVTPTDAAGGLWLGKQAWGARGAAKGLATNPYTLPIAGVIAGVGSLYELIGAERQTTKDIAEITAGNKTATDTFMASGRANNATPEEYQFLARKALADFNKDQALEVALNPGKFPFYRGTVGPDRPYGSQFPFAKWAQFQPEKAGAMFRDMAQQLQIPGVMRSAIQEVKRNELGLPDEGVNKLLEALRNVNPNVYKQSMGTNVEWVDKIFGVGKGAQPINEQLTATTQNFNNLNQPLKGLPSDFSNAGSAAQGFADRVNGLTIDPTLNPFGPRKTGNTWIDSVIGIPPKATGGDVLRTGLVTVHKGEKIVPARVTARWRDEAPQIPREAVRASAQRANRNDDHNERVIERVHDRRPITIHVHGAPGMNTEALAEKVAQKIKHLDELERERG